MNFKPPTVLALAASAAPFAAAGPIAYALCQTGAPFPQPGPTLLIPVARLQHACSFVLCCCRLRFWYSGCRCCASRHPGVQRWLGRLHDGVRCHGTHCPDPLSER